MGTDGGRFRADGRALIAALCCNRMDRIVLVERTDCLGPLRKIYRCLPWVDVLDPDGKIAMLAANSLVAGSRAMAASGRSGEKENCYETNASVRIGRGVLGDAGDQFSVSGGRRSA